MEALAFIRFRSTSSTAAMEVRLIALWKTFTK